MAYILLSDGRHAVVDDADLAMLSNWPWSVSSLDGSAYACRKERPSNKTIYMHQQIAGYKNTDHINGDRLDNRRSNLRESTQSQNCHNSRMKKNNTSGYRGIKWHKRVGRWSASICVDWKSYHLGYFDTPEDAARAYNKAAIKMMGEFARLNNGL